jgi:hypothetical protein
VRAADKELPLQLEVGLGRIPIGRPFVDPIYDQDLAFAGESVIGAVRGRGQPVDRLGVQPGEADAAAAAIFDVAPGMGEETVRAKSLVGGSSCGEGVAEK